MKLLLSAEIMFTIMGICRGFQLQGIVRRSRPRAFAPRVTGSSSSSRRSLALWASPPGKEATWEYKPYVKPKNVRRKFSTSDDDWTVPKFFPVPESRLDMSFMRSSGAGGQNVNKLSTQVLFRFKVDDADWIPEEVRQRIKEQNAHRINKDGIMNVSSQEYRTQAQNRKDALDKIENIILNAWPRPKVRKVKKGISKAAKERNKDAKRRNSLKKANRRNVDY